MGKYKYSNPKIIVHLSPRYKKVVTVPEDYRSDGASGPASDIWSNAWWVHDVLCDRGTWDDGTVLTFDENNLECYDQLDEEGHWQWVCDGYFWGISLWFMRLKWKRKFGHP